MRIDRKALIVSVLALAMLGLAVVPGLAAPEKQFTIVAPTSVAASATTIPVTIHNTTPNGNSNISSLTLTGVGAGLVITGVSPGTGSGFGDNSININSITPIKPGRSTTFTVTVTHNTVGCSGASIVWSSRAFTGNSLGGDEFTYKTYPTQTVPTPVTNVTTALTANCSLSIDPISSGIKGQNVSITARVASGGSSDFTGNISLDVD